MKKYFLPLVLSSLMISCLSSEEESTTQETTQSSNDTISTLDTTSIVEEKMVEEQIPEDIYELDTLTLVEDYVTDFSGEGIFYCFEDSVAFRDYTNNETKYLASKDLNGSSFFIHKVYEISISDYYTECCDPWSEEEFCSYFILVENDNIKGYIKGDYIFEKPEVSPEKVDLFDDLNERTYAFYEAKGFRSCYNGLLMIEDGDSTLSMIKLKEPEYNSGVLDFYGEWVNIREFFMRGDKPVVIMTLGVDGNYSYHFYELTQQNGAYIADNYFSTDIMVTLDEFDNGFDFDSALHEHYRLELNGEDFESSW